MICEGWRGPSVVDQERRDRAVVHEASKSGGQLQLVARREPEATLVQDRASRPGVLGDARHQSGAQPSAAPQHLQGHLDGLEAIDRGNIRADIGSGHTHMRREDSCSPNPHRSGFCDVGVG